MGSLLTIASQSRVCRCLANNGKDLFCACLFLYVIVFSQKYPDVEVSSSKRNSQTAIYPWCLSTSHTHAGLQEPSVPGVPLGSSHPAPWAILLDMVCLPLTYFLSLSLCHLLPLPQLFQTPLPVLSLISTIKKNLHLNHTSDQLCPRFIQQSDFQLPLPT